MSNIVHIFTDGSSVKKNGVTNTGCGIYYVDKLEAGIPLGNSTNNYAELYAIKFALYMFPHLFPDHENTRYTIIIHTDSKYSIGVLVGGNKVNRNIALVTKIQNMIAEIVDRHVFNIIHVKSHTGAKSFDAINNDIVDKIAKKCATTQKKYSRVHKQLSK